MGKIKKFGNVIERFLHGEKGQRFFNFAYSIGAAIVIWGALFKILHLPGGSTLLCIGMGTEIAMFILTAFDRPPKEYAWEEVFPVLDSKAEEDRPDFSNLPTAQGQTVVVNGSGGTSGNVVEGGKADVTTVVAGSQQSGVIGVPVSGAEHLYQHLPELKEVPEIGDFASVSAEYVEQMRNITDQVARLNATYSEQMQDLNRNVAGLNTIYEIQLKSISGQLDTIDHVNRGLKDIRDMYEKSANESNRYCEETEKMARYMRQLNAVYEKMITAMTINMQNPMMGSTPVNPFNQEVEEK